MKSITSILAITIALTGCAGRHYAVCMEASGGGSGCTHKRYSEREAKDLAELLSGGQPINEQVHAWPVDTRKQQVSPKVQELTLPPDHPSIESIPNNDNKL